VPIAGRHTIACFLRDLLHIASHDDTSEDMAAVRPPLSGAETVSLINGPGESAAGKFYPPFNVQLACTKRRRQMLATHLQQADPAMFDVIEKVGNTMTLTTETR
jgi:hypothetical protein